MQKYKPENLMAKLAGLNGITPTFLKKHSFNTVPAVRGT
jgi:hypothetical protein